MARDVFTTTVDNADIMRDLDRLADELPRMVKNCTEVQQQVVVNAMRKNWLLLVGGRNDFVYKSIGHSAHYGRNGADTVGTVGVYKIDDVAILSGRVVTTDSKGRKRKPLSASQIAYWVEFGTSRLDGGGRKKKGVDYSPADLIETAPQPFMSNAFYGTLNEQQAAFAERWEFELSKVTQ